MFDICLAGTGGTMPLKYRWLTSAYIRVSGKAALIDCGEGTQIALKEASCALKPIELLCVTHFHADHISGLPGLLLSMGNEGRTEPLTIVGPKGIGYIVAGLRVVAPELPFEVKCTEIQGKEQSFNFLGCTVTAFGVRHTVQCYGYSFELKRIGRFDPDRAKAAGIPVKAWGMLQKESTVTYDGVTYTSDMVLGAPRRGLKFVYCTDSRPCESIVKNAADADLFICEGMYGEGDKQDKALETKHMTFREASEIAESARVKRLWLTHFSPSLPHPEEFAESAPLAVIPYDGERITLRFDDE